MAHISTGSIVADIRGKVGSEIYSRNRGGPYVKGYTIPVQPDTSFQITARSRLAAAVAEWQSLNPSVQNLWNKLASQVSAEERAEMKGTPTGYGLYLSRSMNLRYIGNLNPPQPVNQRLIHTSDISIVTMDSSALQLVRVNNPTNSRVAIDLRVSGPVSPGISSINSIRFPLRVITFGGFNGNLFLTTSWESRFGALSGFVGDKIFFKWRSVMVQFDIPGGSANDAAGVVLNSFQWKVGVIQP